MLVTASWGSEAVSVEVDVECRSVDALKRCLQEALPKLDVETVRLEVGGRSVNDEEVLGLSEGSVIDILATEAALAAATLREEGRAVSFEEFRRAAELQDVRLMKLHSEVGVDWPPGIDPSLCEVFDATINAAFAEPLNGDSPLHVAIAMGSTDVAMALVDAGCDQAVKNKDGDTPLHLAVSKGNVPVAERLIGAGWDRDAKNQHGKTPLHFAIDVEDVRLAKLLIDAGCDKDAKNNDGDTPLHRVIGKEDLTLSKLLVDAGCDTDVKNNSGHTPLHVALSAKNMQLAKLLDTSFEAPRPKKRSCCVL